MCMKQIPKRHVLKETGGFTCTVSNSPKTVAWCETPLVFFKGVQSGLSGV